jgi:hypothetical protein
MRALILIGLSACASGGGGNVCSPACSTGRDCCGSTCVNSNNDPKNCGACGTACSGSTPLCEGGACKAAPCSVDGGCAQCCGNECCASGQLCCSSEGPVSGGPPSCVTPTNGTCPQGCSPQCVSDRAAKTSPAPVDEREVLERLSTLPISTWSYASDKSGARHLGPMAQDFHDAFSLGTTDKAYDPIDAHGVSLAAIKALHELLDEQNRRIERLEAENRALGQRICR